MTDLKINITVLQVTAVFTCSWDAMHTRFQPKPVCPTADTQHTLPIGPLPTATHRTVQQTQLEHILQGLASLPLAHQLYHKESLHLCGHPATAAIIKSVTQESYCSTYKQLIFSQCEPLSDCFHQKLIFFLILCESICMISEIHKFVFTFSTSQMAQAPSRVQKDYSQTLDILLSAIWASHYVTLLLSSWYTFYLLVKRPINNRFKYITPTIQSKLCWFYGKYFNSKKHNLRTSTQLSAGAVTVHAQQDLSVPVHTSV